VLLILIVIWLLLPVIKGDKSKSYLDRLESTSKEPRRSSDDQDNYSLTSKIFRGSRGIVFAILILIIFAFTYLNELGHVIAYQKQEFYVIDVSPECAVVYTRSDILICKTFNRINKEIDKSYRIYNNSDLLGISILKEDIGPLRYKLAPTPTITNTPLPTNTPTETPPFFCIFS